jgi:hypothetical protein
MKNKLLIMGLTLALPLSSFALGFGPDNALEALTKLKESALEKSNYNAGVDGNQASKEEYNQKISEFNANIKTQRANIQKYKENHQTYTQKINEIKGFKAGVVARQKASELELSTLRSNIQKKKTKEEFIQTTKGEIQSMAISNGQTIRDRNSVIAKIKNLQNLEISKALTTEQQAELNSLHQKNSEIRTKIETNKSVMAGKKKLIETTETEIDNLNVPFMESMRINSLESSIAIQKSVAANQDRQLSGFQSSLENLQTSQDTAQATIDSTQGKLDASVTSLGLVSGKTSGLKLQLANSAAKNALGHMLMKGENSKFKAELMFQSANDVLNNLSANGANREIMAEALKAQAARAIKKSVIGQYIEDQLASSRKQSCEEVTQCMNLQQLGISQSSLIKATPDSQAGPLPGKQPASLQEAE